MDHNDDVAEAVSLVLRKIKAATVTGNKIVSFDFKGPTAYMVSRTIQEMLAQKGYVTYVALPGGLTEDKKIQMVVRMPVREKKK